MDVEIIKPFLKYTISLFKEMYNFTPVYKKAYVLKDLKNHRWDISGVIGIMGKYEGVFAIRLKRSLAFKLLNHSELIANNSKEIIHLTSEMVSEFANIICGNALNMITKEDIDVTVPFSIQGLNHTIAWPVHGKVIAIPFNTPYGSFEIQINISV